MDNTIKTPKEILSEYGAQRAQFYMDLDNKAYSDKAEELKSEALTALEAYVKEAVLAGRIDERNKVDIEVANEVQLTTDSKAFDTPEGLDGYKCLARDIQLDNKDRITALKSEKENLNNAE